MVTAAQIKAVRQSLGENQAVFARRIGVSQAALCMWENHGLPRRALRVIAAANAIVALEIEIMMRSDATGGVSAS